MPTTASMPAASRRSISSHVVMPPAAVTRRAVARADGHDRVHVGALHQPFLVHVRVEELGAVTARARARLDGGDRQHGLPAVDDDAGRRGCPRRRSRARRRPRRRARGRTPTSTTPSRKSAELAITACAPARAPRARARRCGCRRRRGRAAGRRSSARSPRCRRVRARRRGRSAARAETRENRAIHGSAIRRLDGQPLALHELDDVAVLQIDRGNQHASGLQK